MTRILITAILSLLFSSASAQNIFIRKHNSNIDTLYMSYYNYMYLNFKSDCNPKLKSQDADIIPIGECQYYVRPKISSGYCHIYHDTDSDFNPPITFYVTPNIPPPTITLSLPKGEGPGYFNYVTLRHILCEPYFRDGPNSEISYTVMSFIGELEHHNKDLYREPEIYYREYFSGNNFSDEFRKQIGKLYQDDKIILRNIVLKDDIGNLIVIDKVEFKIY